MATDSLRRPGASEALFRRGVELFSKDKYDTANTAFLRAMDMCKCRASVRKQPCILAGILAAIAKNDLKATLAKMTASSTRCDNALHLEAFDSLIATFEKQGRIDEALQSAAKLINLCPREPKAYLRLGKLLRLKQDPAMAYLTYKQGIELVKRKHAGHASLEMLCEQRDKVKPFAKFDPLLMLPIELVRMVFNHVDFITQCRSLRVSKTWKTVLTSPDCSDIWQIQQYVLRNPSQPGLSRLRKAFSAYTNYAKKTTTVLSVNGCYPFFEKFGFMEILFHLKTLKVLQLREPFEASCYKLGTALRLRTVPQLQLTSLYLGSGVQCVPQLMQTLLTATSDSLEELSLFSLPPFDGTRGMWYLDWPRLEKLKVARLSYSERYERALHVDHFMRLTPNLEEAWLDFVTYSPHQLALHWPKLRSLFIGEHAICSVISENLSLGPSLHKDLRGLHLEGRQLNKRIHIPHLEKLEKLSLIFYDELTNEEFERIVKPSIESGTLRELDVRPLPTGIFFPHILYPRPLPDWLHSSSIEYMSVSGPAAPGLEFNSNFETVLPDIIERFPNLRSVDIGKNDVSDSVLAHWVANGVRAIYHRSDYRRADLQEWAAKEHGAKFVNHPPRHIPSMRPDRKLGFNHLISTYQTNQQIIPTQ